MPQSRYGCASCAARRETKNIDNHLRERNSVSYRNGISQIFFLQDSLQNIALTVKFFRRSVKDLLRERDFESLRRARGAHFHRRRFLAGTGLTQNSSPFDTLRASGR